MSAPAERPGDLSIAATGLLADFGRAGLIGLAETQIARHLAHLYDESDQSVMLATALSVTALRAGSVCLDLTRLDQLAPADPDQPDLALDQIVWPDLDPWLERLQVSPLVRVGSTGPGDRPLRLVGHWLYLERSWADQEAVAELLGRLWRPFDQPSDALSQSDVDENERGRGDPDHRPIRPDQPAPASAAQVRACDLARRRHGLVIGGGPGTGKTTTVARVLASLAGDPAPRICLTAPTGKAAAHLDAAVRRNLGQLGLDRLADSIPTAGTIHRVLGIKPWGAVDFGPDRPLPVDLLVVDEVSMLSLRHMRLLLQAVPPTARVVLVGDPDQLASVEAGAVLADIVAAAEQVAAGEPAVPYVRLDHNYRFSGALADLAGLIRDGRADAVVELVASQPDGVEFAPLGAALPTPDQPELTGLRDDVVDVGQAVRRALAEDDWPRALAASQAHRLLCAHRLGPYGVSHWSRLAEAWLTRTRPDHGRGGPWQIGLPVLATRNDDALGVYNGDTGLVVDQNGRRRVVLDTSSGLRLFGPAQLDGLEPNHASTIHKAQGSQYDAVSIVAPPPGASLLTRQLLYTAVTRAQRRVRLIGSLDSIRQAVQRPALRASGLTERLLAPADRPSLS
ncbi:MAG: exodeoxyribonuclease V subunit alpha [Propionibacteriaceae bacterium]|jgi:exodeoxyribonuclease V alpha subunit|nr:exodeoxyribonuclease V subunit alpha [Propionibacteriaceae bacterium]